MIHFLPSCSATEKDSPEEQGHETVSGKANENRSLSDSARGRELCRIKREGRGRMQGKRAERVDDRPVEGEIRETERSRLVERSNGDCQSRFWWVRERT